MSTSPSPAPSTALGVSRRDGEQPAVAWPILVIDRDDRFVHVLGEQDWEFHHDGPDASPPPLLAARPALATPIEGAEHDDPAPAVPVDFFDRDGRRLRPLVAADFHFLGVEATAVLASTDVLMERLERSVSWALGEMDAREIEVVVTPQLPSGDYGAYLDELARIFRASPDRGSAWHNLIHAIS